jgi:hypothetical protein
LWVSFQGCSFSLDFFADCFWWRSESDALVTQKATLFFLERAHVQVVQRVTTQRSMLQHSALCCRTPWLL